MSVRGSNIIPGAAPASRVASAYIRPVCRAHLRSPACPRTSAQACRRRVRRHRRRHETAVQLTRKAIEIRRFSPTTLAQCECAMETVVARGCAGAASAVGRRSGASSRIPCTREPARHPYRMTPSATPHRCVHASPSHGMSAAKERFPARTSYMASSRMTRQQLGGA